jgi:hypothetical protein
LRFCIHSKYRSSHQT